MDKWNGKYRIETARCRFHDYSGGVYHVVICTKDRLNLFGKITKVNDQNVIKYYEIGEYLNDCISNITIHCKYAIPILWQVMPNHVHILLYIDNEKVPYERRIGTLMEDGACPVSTRNAVDFSSFMKNVDSLKGWLSIAIGGLKSAVTAYANKRSISFAWQPRFYDGLIKNESQYNFSIEYIYNNVNTWEDDSLYEAR